MCLAPLRHLFSSRSCMDNLALLQVNICRCFEIQHFIGRIVQLSTNLT